MPQTSLSQRLNERLIELDAKLDATLEVGDNLIEFEEGDEKKGSGAGKVAGAAAGAAGVAGAAAGATYLRGKMASGGNAKGKDAFRIGKRALAGDIRSGGVKAGGLLRKAGVGIAKAAKRFDMLERVNELSARTQNIINFETVDDATVRKPVQKAKAPNHAALVGVGMGTVGAAAGYAGGMRHKGNVKMGKKVLKAGKHHAAQIGKATSRGVTVAKAGYTSAKGKIGATLRPMGGAIVSKFKKA